MLLHGGELHASTILSLEGMAHALYCIEDWIDLRYGTDSVIKRNVSSCAGNGAPIPESSSPNLVTALIDTLTNRFVIIKSREDV